MIRWRPSSLCTTLQGRLIHFHCSSLPAGWNMHVHWLGHLHQIQFFPQHLHLHGEHIFYAHVQELKSCHRINSHSCRVGQQCCILIFLIVLSHKGGQGTLEYIVNMAADSQCTW